MLKKENVKKTAEILIENIFNIDAVSVTIAFSGGIDSSLLAFLIKKYSKKIENIELIYVGLKDKYDYFNSIDSAQRLEIDLKQSIIGKQEILCYKNEISVIIESDDLIEISYLLPFYGVLKKMTNKTIVMGQGSDELFMGYHKFIVNSNQAQKLSKEMYNNLLEIVSVREYKLAQEYNKKLELPFISQKLYDFVSPLDIKYKLNGENTKILLREVGEYVGLPYEIAIKPKKAAQYGSGIWKILNP